jgi:hypothetical protein
MHLQTLKLLPGALKPGTQRAQRALQRDALLAMASLTLVPLCSRSVQCLGQSLQKVPREGVWGVVGVNSRNALFL